VRLNLFLKHALGNALKEEQEKIRGDSSSATLLISKILYSGTHSGDVIPRDDLDSLKHEIALVRGVAGSKKSSELESFLAEYRRTGRCVRAP